MNNSPVFPAHRSFTSRIRNVREEMCYAKIMVGSSNYWSNCISSIESHYYTGKLMLADIWQFSLPKISALLFVYNNRIINSLSWKNFRDVSSGFQWRVTVHRSSKIKVKMSEINVVKCSLKSHQDTYSPSNSFKKTKFIQFNGLHLQRKIVFGFIKRWC